MKVARPVMPWVKIFIKNADSNYYHWCIDKFGPCGVNWYAAAVDPGEELFYSFRYEEDAAVFKLKFAL